MSKEISHYCKTCNACVARISGQKQHKAPLGQFLVGEPMERVALNILGPLPVSTKGSKYILAMTYFLLDGQRLQLSMTKKYILLSQHL